MQDNWNKKQLNEQFSINLINRNILWVKDDFPCATDFYHYQSEPRLLECLMENWCVFENILLFFILRARFQFSIKFILFHGLHSYNIMFRVPYNTR